MGQLSFVLQIRRSLSGFEGLGFKGGKEQAHCFKLFGKAILVANSKFGFLWPIHSGSEF